ncbi:MAG: malectin, partial [Rubripirellula sp.]|nr:malectin [Rubripirellula sp.]
LWMQGDAKYPWVNASAAEGLREFKLKGLKPGNYTVRLYFNEPDAVAAGERLQTIQLQGSTMKEGFDVTAESGGLMHAISLQFQGIKVEGELTLGLSSSRGKTMISGLELIRDKPSN